MGWTLPLGTVRGTAVRVHWSFLLFLVWIGTSLFAQGGWPAASNGLAFFVLLFACIVLHEFGHIVAARRYGIRTPDVILLPIGGMSRLEKIPEEPREELTIALAGPAVSLAIALALIAVLGALPEIDSLPTDSGWHALLAQLAYANLFLGLFNLLPAFPMDGGRVLRAVLGWRYSHDRSTNIAGKVGQAAAILFALAALLLGHVILLFIALFIFLSAGAERGMAQMRAATVGLQVGDLTIDKFVSLPLDAPISAAAEALLRTDQRTFPVLGAQGQLEGALTRDTIGKAIASAGQDEPVSAAMNRDIPVMDRLDDADDAIRLLRDGAPAIGVHDAQGRLVGLITWDNLVEHLMIAQAWRKAERREAHAPPFVLRSLRSGR